MPRKFYQDHLAYMREYYKKRYHEGKAWACRPENKAKIQKKRRNRTLKQYGLDVESWEAMFNAQGRKCAICGSADPRGTSWATDHHHARGTLRAILCSKCNIAIGHLKDDPELCRKAAEYLEGHS